MWQHHRCTSIKITSAQSSIYLEVLYTILQSICPNTSIRTLDVTERCTVFNKVLLMLVMTLNWCPAIALPTSALLPMNLLYLMITLATSCKQCSTNMNVFIRNVIKNTYTAANNVRLCDLNASFINFWPTHYHLWPWKMEFSNVNCSTDRALLLPYFNSYPWTFKLRTYLLLTADTVTCNPRTFIGWMWNEWNVPTLKTVTFKLSLWLPSKKHDCL